MILWLLGSGLVLLLLDFPVFFWEKNLPTLPGGWAAGRDRSGPLPEESARNGPLTCDPPAPRAGHQIQDLGDRAGPYRYEYIGFRLIAKSPSRYYLVSKTADYNSTKVVVLPDDDTVRVELS
ncbi:hypothetical protein [Streptomyces mirabilis]|uniref:hypothetical protein n=1 Tax=Streptomyces mirabilis TaxID=68239 RepID=UPI0036CCFA28